MLIVVAIVSSLLTLVNLFILNPVNTQITEALTFFLSYLNNLNFIFNVETIFICLKILAAFYSALAFWWVMLWLTKIFMHTTT